MAKQAGMDKMAVWFEMKNTTMQAQIPRKLYTLPDTCQIFEEALASP